MIRATRGARESCGTGFAVVVEGCDVGCDIGFRGGWGKERGCFVEGGFLALEVSDLGKSGHKVGWGEVYFVHDEGVGGAE